MNEKSLTCYCQPPEECFTTTAKQSVCYSNTGCFHSIIDESGIPFESFGCFKNNSDHYLMTCVIKETSNFRIMCCQDGDFCNQKKPLVGKAGRDIYVPASQNPSWTPQRIFTNQWPESVSLELKNSKNELQERKWFSHTGNTGLYYYLSARSVQYIAIAMVPVLVLLSLSLFLILIIRRQNYDEKDKTKKHLLPRPSWIDFLHKSFGRPNNLEQNSPEAKPSGGRTISHQQHRMKNESTPCSNPSINSPFTTKYFPIRGINLQEELSSLFDMESQKCVSVTAVNSYILSSPSQKKPIGCCSKAYKKMSFCHPSESIAKELTGTSGSGSGRPVLVQRTIARQIRLEECVGTGRFGEVWRGIYEGENVAVKIFSSRDEASWVRETTIFNRFTLQHENLIGYVASDITSRNGCTQLWIVMPFFPRGTLFDYLQQNTLSLEETFNLAKSAAAGLCYLHSVITGVHGKPGIVHRDVKSKNILIQSNLTCCIADLGLAIVNHSTLGMERNSVYKAGTKRYMSPELLSTICTSAQFGQNSAPDYEETETDPILTPLTSSDEGAFPMPSFEILKASDVYSFGLVLWELARRCRVQGDNADPYILPYGDYIPPEPTFHTMYQTVCVNGIRPTLSPRWSKDSVLSRFVRMDQECWCARPEERLTMLRIKKTLVELISQANDSSNNKKCAVGLNNCTRETVTE